MPEESWAAQPRALCVSFGVDLAIGEIVGDVRDLSIEGESGILSISLSIFLVL